MCFLKSKNMRIQRRAFFFLTGSLTTLPVFPHFAELHQFLNTLNWETFVFASHTGNVLNLWHHDSFLHIVLRSTMCKITTVSPFVLIHHSHTSSFRVNHSVFWFSEAFWVGALSLKKKTTVTSASPTDQQMKGAHQKQFRCLFPTCTHRKSGKPSFRLSPQSFRKVVRPPFDILNYTQKREVTQTNRGNTLTLKKAHHVQTVTKIEGLRQVNSFHNSSHSISPNTSLSPKVIARPCWEKGFKSEVIDVVLVILKRRRALTSCPVTATAAPNRASWAAKPPHISQLRRRVTARPKGNLLSHRVETDQGTCFHCVGWDAGREFNHLPTGPIKDKHLTTAVCPTSLKNQRMRIQRRDLHNREHKQRFWPRKGDNLLPFLSKKRKCFSMLKVDDRNEKILETKENFRKYDTQKY